MCNFVVVATTKLQINNNNDNNNKKIELLIIAQKMYVDGAFCSCCYVQCVILLLLQQQNYRLTTTMKQQQKDWVIDNCTEDVCRLSFLFLLLCLMCNFVVATTKLQIENNNNNNNKNNKNNKITLHKCPDQFWTTNIYWITVLILLHCNVWLAFPIVEQQMTKIWTHNTLELSTILGHQMPLLGGTLDQMSAWPKG